MSKPLTYAIYKGMSGKFGGLQFSAQLPHYYNQKDKDFTGERALDGNGRIREADGWKQREGAVFVETSQAIGANKYDWDNKITFALSIEDIGKVLFFLETGANLSIMHDPGAKTEAQGAIKKYLNLSSPKGLLEGGAFLKLTMEGMGQKKEHMIPMTPDECIILRQLLKTMAPKCLNW
jgi:hypothetical protein